MDLQTFTLIDKIIIFLLFPSVENAESRAGWDVDLTFIRLLQTQGKTS